MAFTLAQGKSLVTMPKISGFISMTLSFFIVLSVAREFRRTRKKTYNRLVAIIAALDVITSFGCFLGTWPMPKGSSLWATGSEGTCRAQGILMQFTAVTSFCYNWCLSMYYLLVIRYGWTERRIEKAEPAMHVFSFSVGIITTTIGGFVDAYNPATLWCWIGPKEDVVSNDLAFQLRWFLFYTILWMTIILVAFNTCLIYFHVQRLERKTRHTLIQNQSLESVSIRAPPRLSIPSIAPVKNQCTMSQDDKSFSSDDSIAISSKNLVPEEPPKEDEMSVEKSENPDLEVHRGLILKATARLVGKPARKTDDDIEWNTPPMDPPKAMEEPSSLGFSGEVPPKPAEVRFITVDETVTSTSIEQSTENTKLPRQIRPRRNAGQAANTKLRQVATQSFYYVGAFFVTWTFVSVLRLVQALSDVQPPYIVALVAATTAPIQGLPNLLIFLRPKVLKLRERHPDMSWFTAMWISLWGGDRRLSTASSTRFRSSHPPTSNSGISSVTQ